MMTVGEALCGLPPCAHFRPNIPILTVGATIGRPQKILCPQGFVGDGTTGAHAGAPLLGVGVLGALATIINPPVNNNLHDYTSSWDMVGQG